MRQGSGSRGSRGFRRYRPEHAWLGTPGDGVPLKRRRHGGRWQFRWHQLRILLIAAAIAALTWSQLPEFKSPPPARALAKASR